jgi:hypothetical protein
MTREKPNPLLSPIRPNIPALSRSRATASSVSPDMVAA